MVLGPIGLGLVDVALPEDARRVESIAEIALLIGLFCVGLRLRAPLSWQDWRRPLRLATLSMLTTVLLVAAIAHVVFGLSFPEGLLLGAILAPTDPLFISEVHLPAGAVADAERAGLAAEGAIGSALAAPLLVLALGALGGRDLAPAATRWLVLDVLWSVGAGAAIGWLLGRLAWQVLAKLARESRDSLPGGLLICGLAAVSYCGALALGGQGLVAVLVAGLVLSHGGRLQAPPTAYRLPPRLMQLAQRVERVAAVAVALLLGALLTVSDIRAEMFALALLMVLVVRPLAAELGLGGLQVAAGERWLARWFGVRGTASLYCLMIAANQGLPTRLVRDLTALVLVTLATSLLLQALAATPLVSGRLGDAPR